MRKIKGNWASGKAAKAAIAALALAVLLAALPVGSVFAVVPFVNTDRNQYLKLDTPDIIQFDAPVEFINPVTIAYKNVVFVQFNGFKPTGKESIMLVDPSTAVYDNSAPPGVNVLVGATSARIGVITINPGGKAYVFAPSLPFGVVDKAYQGNELLISADSGIDWYIRVANNPLTPISGMPLFNGLKIVWDANGMVARITGTPTTAGTYKFSVVGLKSGTTNIVVDEHLFEIVVYEPLLIEAPSRLPSGTVGQTYSQIISAIGGTPPYKWGLRASGSTVSMPVLNFIDYYGLRIEKVGNDIKITGTPTQAGTIKFWLDVTDGKQTAQKEFTLVVEAATPGQPPVITAPGSYLLPPGVVGTAYEAPLSAGPGTITWSVEAGSALPSGLSIQSGAIKGTPLAPGTFTFTLRASNGTPPDDTAEYRITISAAAVAQAPTISTASLQGGIVGQAYSDQLSAAPGPIVWSVEPGSALPGGLSLSQAGALTGTPTAAGSYTFTLRASNGAAPDATKSFTVSIAAKPPVAASQAPKIIPATLLPGQVGQPYTKKLEATSSSTATIEFSLVSGKMPAGLSIAKDGTISGTPTERGSFIFTVGASNGHAPNATKILTIAIK